MVTNLQIRIVSKKNVVVRKIELIIVEQARVVLLWSTIVPVITYRPSVRRPVVYSVIIVFLLGTSGYYNSVYVLVKHWFNESMLVTVLYIAYLIILDFSHKSFY